MKSKKKVKFHNINQSALYKCKSKKRLAGILQCDIKNLKDITYNIKEYYYVFSSDKKNSSEKRTITAPGKNLKKLQKRVLKLLNKVEKPEWLMSSTIGKSYIDNAKYHVEANYVCKSDIKNFYSNCKRERVYLFFLNKLKTAPDIAKILTDLTTFDLKIPTGSPSSQILAYFAYENMFKEMKDISNKHGFKMTLYVDDIVFSTQDYVDYKSLIREINIVARRYNHSLKLSKTKFYKVSKGASVTGVIIKEHQLKIPNNLRKSTVDSFLKLKELNQTSEELNSLVGKVKSARSIEKDHFNGIYSYLPN